MTVTKNGETNGTAMTAHAVTDQLRSQILDGYFKPGEKLGQAMLAARFNTSRMPVRTALSQLEAEGLVTAVAGGGAWVSKPDGFEFQQIYKMREALEPLAIQESIPRLSKARVNKIGEIEKLLREAIMPTVKIEDFLRLDHQFHLMTYSGVGYEPLRQQVERLWNSTQHYRRALAHELDEERAEMTLHDHALIVDSIRRKDLQAAGAVVGLHIRRTRHLMDGAFDIFG